jgi:hypothetical protein
MLGRDPDKLTDDEVVAYLRERGITIVCTPVSITLDTGTDDLAASDPERPPAAPPASTSAGRQLPISGLHIPRQRRATDNPHHGPP